MCHTHTKSIAQIDCNGFLCLSLSLSVSLRDLFFLCPVYVFHVSWHSFIFLLFWYTRRTRQYSYLFHIEKQNSTKTKICTKHLSIDVNPMSLFEVFRCRWLITCCYLFPLVRFHSNRNFEHEDVHSAEEDQVKRKIVNNQQVNSGLEMVITAPFAEISLAQAKGYQFHFCHCVHCGHPIEWCRCWVCLSVCVRAQLLGNNPDSSRCSVMSLRHLLLLFKKRNPSDEMRFNHSNNFNKVLQRTISIWLWRIGNHRT